MSQPRQVYKFAKEFVDSQKPLNILVNNAGAMINERQAIEGLEANFSTNTLGTHILTKTLLPLLEKAEKPRVVKRTKLEISLNNLFMNLFLKDNCLVWRYARTKTQPKRLKQ